MRNHPYHDAQYVQSHGRGNDTMLVHMTPREVGGLQALAKANGGSLTINPHTGLYEAGWLDSVLPMVAGGLLAMTGVGAPLAALMVGGGTGLITGDWKKGLMAGMGAFGGAGLGSALAGGTAAAGQAGAAAAGEAAKTGATEVAKTAATEGAKTAATEAATALPGAASTAAPGSLASIVPGSASTAPGSLASIVPQSATSALPGAATPGTLANAVSTAAPQNAATDVLANIQAPTVGPATDLASTSNLATTTPSAAAPSNIYAGMDKGAAFQKGFGSGWTEATKGTPWGSTIGKAGITLNALEAMKPEYKKKEEKPEEDYYEGPYMATPRERTDLAGRSPTDSSEASYFTEVNPLPNYIKVSEYEDWKKQHGMAASGGLMALAKGGKGKGKGVNLENGAFIVDARTVSELGNGSSNAGQELLSKYGGKALKGPGDGVSDSIRANIGGKQEARVARDEVKFSAEAVKRLGGGSAAKGTAKLYAMMDKAHAARKSAKRGQDTGLKSILV